MALGLYFMLLLSLASGLWAQDVGEARPSDGCCVGKRCPKGWTQHDDYCYKFNLNEKDWADAEVGCVAVGGNLASIHTKDHYDFVKGLIKTSAGTNKQTWVGGSDAVKVSDLTTDFEHLMVNVQYSAYLVLVALS
uniref:C-type lectin domain-containing protein n=2 Tax=Monopterus albus TaxID=43700 RepID=A0A3Q3IE96_MONAL